MLENPATSGGAATDTSEKRYAPPNQRSRSLSRRKSGEKGLVSVSRFVPITNQGDASNSNLVNALIPLEGCCGSEASRLLNDRWAAATQRSNDTSIDPSERPTVYSGSGASAWGHHRLPHQMDFLGELRRAIRNSEASLGT